MNWDLMGSHTKPTLFSVLWERNEMGLYYLAKISAITIFKELLFSAVTAIQNMKDRCQIYQSRRVEAKALSDISRVETFIIFSQMVSLIWTWKHSWRTLSFYLCHLQTQKHLLPTFTLTVSKDILWKGNMKRHVLHLFFIISLFLWIYLIKCKIKHLE